MMTSATNDGRTTDSHSGSGRTCAISAISTVKNTAQRGSRRARFMGSSPGWSAIRRPALRARRARRMIGALPDEEHFTIAFDAGERYRENPREGLRGIAFDPRDARDRQAEREHATEAGGDQQVAYLHVLVLRHVGQFER